MEKSGEFNVERAVNILKTGNKFQKKGMLKEVRSLFDSLDTVAMKNVFDKLLVWITLTLQDEAEICRDASADVFLAAVCQLDPNPDYLADLVTGIHRRLSSDTALETSEELRLKYFEIIFHLLEKYQEMIPPFVEDLVDIMCKGIVDVAPQVKRKSCACVIRLAQIPALNQSTHFKKLIIPLAEAIKHQHWRVRVAVIEAFEMAVLNGDPKILPDALPALTNRFFDDNHNVRMALTKLIGNWMLNHFDRYSYFSQMLPLMLTSLTDNDEGVRQEAEQLWSKVGDKYWKENLNNLKDQVDWLSQAEPDHYPPGVKRPCIGRRALVEREIGKFAAALGKELSDWSPGVRVKAAQLLSQVVLHAEAKVIQDLHKIILPMARAAMDEELPSVVHYVRLAAEYLGYFVPPKVYCQLILDQIHGANYGELRIVSSIIKGSSAEDLIPHLSSLAHLLNESTFKGREQQARLELVEAVLEVCSEGSFQIGESIFTALIGVAGLAVSEDVALSAQQLLERFAQLGGGDRRIVFNKYCKPVVESLLEKHWAVNSHEQFIFTALICYTGEVVEENVDTFLEVLRRCLYKESTDPECILKVIVALNKLITDEDITLPTTEVRERFKACLLEEMLVETLSWKAGRSAEAVRSMASTTLYLLLPPPSGQLNPRLLSTLLSLVEDTVPQTRQLALLSIAKSAAFPQIHQHENFAKTITVVLKRLDDSDVKTRETSLETLRELCRHERRLSEGDQPSGPLFDFIFSTLLIHLDDPQSSFQLSVLDVLKDVSMVNPEVFLRKIRVEQFRDKDIATQLTNYIQELLKNKSS